MHSEAGMKKLSLSPFLLLVPALRLSFWDVPSLCHTTKGVESVNLSE